MHINEHSQRTWHENYLESPKERTSILFSRAQMMALREHVESNDTNIGQVIRDSLSAQGIIPHDDEDVPMRMCRDCLETYPARKPFFNRDSKGWNGTKSLCAKCEATNKRYQRHQRKYIAQQRKRKGYIEQPDESLIAIGKLALKLQA
jgi:hypothetical protein